MNWLDQSRSYIDEGFLGIPVTNFLIAFGILLAAFIFRKIFTYLIINYLLRFTKHTRFKMDQLLVENLRRPFSFFFILVGLLFAVLWFTKPIDINTPQQDLETIQSQMQGEFEVIPKPMDPGYLEWIALTNIQKELMGEEGAPGVIETLQTAVAAAEKNVTAKEKLINDTYPVVPEKETPEYAAYQQQDEELKALKEDVNAKATELQKKRAEADEVANKLKQFQEVPSEGDKGYEAYQDLLKKEGLLQNKLRMARLANTWLGKINKFMLKAIKAFGAFIVFWIIFNLVEVISVYLAGLAKRTGSPLDDQLIPMIKKSLRFFVVIMGLLVIFQNMGYSLTSVVAGLGLGGLAFALAAKDTVGNFFGSITVLLDRPFRVGDWIVVGKSEGTVEEVGFRSTRIRTFYDSQIVIPNAEMANATIDNMGQRRYRRKYLTLGLTCDTPPFKVEAFCEGVREFIRTHPYTRKDYFQVYFSNITASSLDVMLYVFVKVPDWNTELREWHRLFLCITRLAERMGVELAFPTQTILLPGTQLPASVKPASVETDDKPAPQDMHQAHELGRKLAHEVNDEISDSDLNNVPPPVDFNNSDSLLTSFSNKEKKN
ncbi:mechanosensitive ion channel domain-containing protein [Planctomycetota bacterium]